MRQVTTEAVEAFMNGEAFAKSNTTVTVDNNVVSMILFGHTIAKRNLKSKKVRINNCGYETNTTKERLNGIISEVVGYSRCIYQRKGKWYWDNYGETVLFPSNKWKMIN